MCQRLSVIFLPTKRIPHYSPEPAAPPAYLNTLEADPSRLTETSKPGTTELNMADLISKTIEKHSHRLGRVVGT